MTPEEREALYDREIAPALMELARKCEDNGLSFIATVEWDPGHVGRTATIQENASVSLRLVHWACEAKGNVDTLVLHIKRYARLHGHSSLVLHMLGEPYEADATPGQRVPSREG